MPIGAPPTQSPKVATVIKTPTGWRIKKGNQAVDLTAQEMRDLLAEMFGRLGALMADERNRA